MKFASLIALIAAALVVSWPLSHAAFQPVHQQAGIDRGQSAKPPASAERRVALVIGNGKYGESYADGLLDNPVNDANGLAAALRELRFEVISGVNQDLNGMRRLIRQFGERLRGGENGLFFFAGHGVQVNGINYLIPIGHQIEREADVELEAVSAYSVLRQMEDAGAPVNLVLLDACRDNPFRSLRRSTGQRGLVQMSAPSGTLIVYATKPGNTAADGRGRPNSPFTTSLLQHIRTPGLRVEDFFKRVVLSVEDLTSRKQSPWVEGLLRGDFYFIAPRAEPVSPVNPQPLYSGDQAFWRAIEASTDPQDFRDYLKQYPTGEYAALARRNLRRLEALPASNTNIAPATNPNAAAPPKPTPTPTPAVAYAKVGGAAVRLVAMPFTTAAVDGRGTVRKFAGQPAQGFVEELGNGVRLELVELTGNSFEMGALNTEANHETDEAQRHRVTVASFYMGRYEITQAQWQAVMGSLPDVGFKGGDLPVERVSWNEAVEFCQKLSAKTGREYRLPTEAEWEYAARAGTQTPFAFGATITPEIVNYNGNYPYGNAPKGSYRQKTVPVGSPGVANAWGLYDMHGNVYEWCHDIWHSNYDGAPTDGSAWLSGGDSSLRVLRGGSCFNYGRSCRAANRLGIVPGARDYFVGLRVVVSARTRP